MIETISEILQLLHLKALNHINDSYFTERSEILFKQLGEQMQEFETQVEKLNQAIDRMKE